MWWRCLWPQQLLLIGVDVDDGDVVTWCRAAVELRAVTRPIDTGGLVEAKNMRFSVGYSVWWTWRGKICCGWFVMGWGGWVDM